MIQLYNMIKATCIFYMYTHTEGRYIRKSTRTNTPNTYLGSRTCYLLVSDLYPLSTLPFLNRNFTQLLLCTCTFTIIILMHDNTIGNISSLSICTRWTLLFLCARDGLFSFYTHVMDSSLSIRTRWTLLFLCARDGLFSFYMHAMDSSLSICT